jgi:hypothetical protein
MNLRSINTVASTWKRVNVQYITLAAGLTLAVAVAAGAGAFDRTASRAPAAAGASQASTLSTTSGSFSRTSYAASVPQTLVYIVDSQAQADAIAQTAAQEVSRIADFGLPLPNVSRYFFLADSPEAYDEAQQRISMLSWDLWESGIDGGFSVLDVRQAQ